MSLNPNNIGTHNTKSGRRKSNAELAAQAVANERDILRNLKRLSIGALTLIGFDPDFLGGDSNFEKFVNKQQHKRHSQVNNQAMVQDFVPGLTHRTSVNMGQDGPPSGSTSPTSVASATVPTPSNKQIQLDTSKLLWVPATSHPGIAPENFRKHVQSTITEMTENLTNESYSDDDSVISLRHTGSSSSNYIESKNMPSLKELTNELEKLSNMAGLAATDAATLARTLSTSSLSSYSSSCPPGSPFAGGAAVDNGLLRSNSEDVKPKDDTSDRELPMQSPSKPRSLSFSNSSPETTDGEHQDLDSPLALPNGDIKLKRSKWTTYRKKTIKRDGSVREQPRDESPDEKENLSSRRKRSQDLSKHPLPKLPSFLAANAPKLTDEQRSAADEQKKKDREEQRRQAREKLKMEGRRIAQERVEIERQQKELDDKKKRETEEIERQQRELDLRRNKDRDHKDASFTLLQKENIDYKKYHEQRRVEQQRNDKPNDDDHIRRHRRTGPGSPQNGPSSSPKNSPATRGMGIGHESRHHRGQGGERKLQPEVSITRNEQAQGIGLHKLQDPVNIQSKEHRYQPEDKRRQNRRSHTYQQSSQRQSHQYHQQSPGKQHSQVATSGSLPSSSQFANFQNTSKTFLPSTPLEYKRQSKTFSHGPEDSDADKKHLLLAAPEISKKLSLKNKSQSFNDELLGKKKKLFSSWGRSKDKKGTVLGSTPSDLPRKSSMEYESDVKSSFEDQDSPSRKKLYESQSIQEDDTEEENSSSSKKVFGLFKKKSSKSSKDKSHSSSSEPSLPNGIMQEYQERERQEELKQEHKRHLRQEFKHELKQQEFAQQPYQEVSSIDGKYGQPHEKLAQENPETKLALEEREPEDVAVKAKTLAPDPNQIDILSSLVSADMTTQEKLQTFRHLNAGAQKPNQPVQYTDSAFGFPLPPLTHSTIIMLDHRFPMNVERAIYRLSHLKLANPKRELRQQVLLSNFMYAYLNLVNHTLLLQNIEEGTAGNPLEDDVEEAKEAFPMSGVEAYN